MSNLKLAAAVAIAGCNAMVALTNGGKIAVYDGAQPADPSVAVTTQKKLVEFTLLDPAFGAAVDGGVGATATLNLPSAEPALDDGTATWFRVVDDADAALWDGDVTDTSGNGDMKISSTNVVQGIDVSIVSLTYRQRKTKAP